jgi:DNA-3-methyladenine glycosylase I
MPIRECILVKESCPWCTATPDYLRYHNEEWGVPSDDDSIHFEFLVLESAQAGLSWLTILKKREGYREAFANFNPRNVAAFDEAMINTLKADPSIVRNRLKIATTITNAQYFLTIQQEYGSFARYMWSYFCDTPIQNSWKTMAEVPATSKESDQISKDLKKRGFKFFGSTICYAYLQALGFTNDHLITCPRHQACKKLANDFRPHWLEYQQR